MKKLLPILVFLFICNASDSAEKRPLPKFLENGLVAQNISLELLKSNAEFPLTYNMEQGWEELSNGTKRSKAIFPQNGFFINWGFMGTKVDGQLHGKAYKYYDCKYKSGQPGEQCLKWNLLSVTAYKNGVKHGESRRWGSDGKLWYVHTYENGEEAFREDHFRAPEFYTTTKFSVNTTETVKYEDGVKRQEEIRSTIEGKKYPVTTMKREYYPNGKMKAEWDYSKDHRNPEYAKYDINGERLYSNTEDAPTKSWIDKKYDPDGNLLSETTFLNGKKDGPYVEYYPNGQVKNKWTWKKGLAVGMHYSYDENGKLLNKQNVIPHTKRMSIIDHFSNKNTSIIGQGVVTALSKNKTIILFIFFIFICILAYEKILAHKKD